MGATRGWGLFPGCGASLWVMEVLAEGSGEGRLHNHVMRSMLGHRMLQRREASLRSPRGAGEGARPSHCACGRHPPQRRACPE